MCVGGGGGGGGIFFILFCSLFFPSIPGIGIFLLFFIFETPSLLWSFHACSRTATRYMFSVFLFPHGVARDVNDLGCYLKVISGCQQLDKETR